MTLSSFSNSFVSVMLSWLKGVASWVLRLFNLAGSTGVSPLLWLSQNWAKLLALFLFIGIAVDIVVWLVRWRPYWVWFRKERVIVNDEKFFAGGRIDHQRFTEDDDIIEDDWSERDFVVASSVAQRPEHRPRPARRVEEKPRRGRSEETRVPARGAKAARKRRTAIGTIVKRREDEERIVEPVGMDEPMDGGLFGVDAGVADSYEDEVFNVNSLPDPARYGEDDGEVESLFSFEDEKDE